MMSIQGLLQFSFLEKNTWQLKYDSLAKASVYLPSCANPPQNSAGEMPGDSVGFECVIELF